MAMTLRLDEEREAKLRLVADEEGRSMHAVVVAAIDDYLTQRETVRKLTNEIIEQHAALLDRLAG